MNEKKETDNLGNNGLHILCLAIKYKQMREGIIENNNINSTSSHFGHPIQSIGKNYLFNTNEIVPTNSKRKEIDTKMDNSRIKQRKNPKGLHQFTSVEEMKKTPFLIQLNSKQLSSIEKAQKNFGKEDRLGKFIEINGREKNHVFISLAALDNLLHVTNVSSPQYIRQNALHKCDKFLFNIKPLQELNKDIANYTGKYINPCTRYHGLISVDSLLPFLIDCSRSSLDEIVNIVSNELKQEKFVIIPDDNLKNYVNENPYSFNK